MTEFKTVRGMRDLFGEDSETMLHIEEKARETAKLFGYEEIITPIVESYELLAAKSGDEVKSRMFVFKDLGGRNVALRPEFTASVARLVATTLRNAPRPYRLFCVGSIYRYDEPQKGRYREFWQSNYELMGTDRPEADAEILLLTARLMQSVGLDFSLKLGHTGIWRGIFNQEGLPDNVQNSAMQLMDKKQYDDALELVQKAGLSKKCTTILQELIDLKGKKVFNIIDNIATIVHDYPKACAAVDNLREILSLVLEIAPETDMMLETGFARGLEYYTGMIFEVYVPNLEIALGGGGRYDRLIELFGGNPIPAVGVAHGLDRMMLAMKGRKTSTETRIAAPNVVIPVNEEMRKPAFMISQKLRTEGIPVEMEIMGKKMGKALEDANKRKMKFAIIVGEEEWKKGLLVVRDLEKREQTTLKIEEAHNKLRK